MSRSYVASAIAGAFVLGLATAAIAATKGEFNNLCTMGLAGHKIMHTDCSVNTNYKGKTYCFSNKQDKAAFRKNPSASVAKAEAFYKKHPQG
jgi:YHS domain-containing protein